ncbi:hypothetical protein GpartN1_g5576.t1 [Galdieria partita]|uniref:Methyltransferase type 11 domain-containing protein n=1 Tax=Galdieria partita TaxID=83374 RepID=A0A9C7Q0F1_9RHOD|nr:hypothetical protein GpartN1_g5576.t1 [Galdieria partita]
MMKDRYAAFGFSVPKYAKHTCSFHNLCDKNTIRTWNRKRFFSLLVANKRTSLVARRVMDTTTSYVTLERIADLVICPNCKNSLVSENNRKLTCLCCRRIFFQDPSLGYLNLCIDNSSGYRPLQQELFKNPVTSFLYERGWRNNFQSMGYTLKEEVKLVTDYFHPKNPDVLVDLSCGTGYVTRKLAKTRKYSRIIGIDLSENMLKEAYRRMLLEDCDLFTLIRANVSCLPVKDNVVDALYCGAALHCWPKVQDGLAEMYRILKPDALVFATTFISNYSPAFSRCNAYRFFTKKELEWLFKSRGFRQVNVQILKSPSIMQFVQSAIIRCCK